MHVTIVIFFVFFATLIFLNIVIYTFKYGISPMPSSYRVNQEIIKFISLRKITTFIDLGSGWGWLSCYVAKKNPHLNVIGYEISWIPFWISLFFKKIGAIRNVHFYRKNFLNHSFSQPSSLIYCYLYCNIMPILENKLKNEIDPTTIIISNTFGFYHWPPYSQIKISNLYQTNLYFYKPNHNKKS